MTVSKCVFSTVIKDLDSFWFGTIINSSVVNILVHVSWWTNIYIFVDCEYVCVCDCCIIGYLGGTAKQFSKVVVPIYIPTHNIWRWRWCFSLLKRTLLNLHCYFRVKVKEKQCGLILIRTFCSCGNSCETIWNSFVPTSAQTVMGWPSLGRKVSWRILRPHPSVGFLNQQFYGHWKMKEVKTGRFCGPDGQMVGDKAWVNRNDTQTMLTLWVRLFKEEPEQEVEEMSGVIKRGDILVDGRKKSSLHATTGLL